MSEAAIMEFDNSDIKRNTLVEPAWYRVRLLGVDAPKVSSKGDSFNYLAKGIIMRNADNDSEDYKDVPVYWNFNSKVRSFAIGLCEACGESITEPGRIDLNALAGREFEQFIGTREYNGAMQNDPQHKYRKVKELREA